MSRTLKEVLERIMWWYGNGGYDCMCVGSSEALEELYTMVKNTDLTTDSHYDLMTKTWSVRSTVSEQFIDDITKDKVLEYMADEFVRSFGKRYDNS